MDIFSVRVFICYSVFFVIIRFFLGICIILGR